MAKGWVKLHKLEGGTIHVNLAQVSSLEPVSKGTMVWFLAGPKQGKCIVTESPEHILKPAKAS